MLSNIWVKVPSRKCRSNLLNIDQGVRLHCSRNGKSKGLSHKMIIPSLFHPEIHLYSPILSSLVYALAIAQGTLGTESNPRPDYPSLSVPVSSRENTPYSPVERPSPIEGKKQDSLKDPHFTQTSVIATTSQDRSSTKSTIDDPTSRVENSSTIDTVTPEHRPVSHIDPSGTTVSLQDRLTPKPLQEISPQSIHPKAGMTPDEKEIPEMDYQVRNWNEQTFSWKASELQHYPVYFEDLALERYGHSMGLLQPVWSAGIFFGQLLTFPYDLGSRPPFKEIYEIGHPRPGEETPRLLYQIPFNVGGGLSAAAAWTLLPVIFP